MAGLCFVNLFLSQKAMIFEFEHICCENMDGSNITNDSVLHRRISHVVCG